MKTCAKKAILVSVFLCASLCFRSAFAATTPLPGPKQQTAVAKAQPSIQVKESDYNFGEIMEGTPEIEHEFIVRNTGKEVLKIERVQTG